MLAALALSAALAAPADADGLERAHATVVTGRTVSLISAGVFVASGVPLTICAFGSEAACGVTIVGGGTAAAGLLTGAAIQTVAGNAYLKRAGAPNSGRVFGIVLGSAGAAAMVTGAVALDPLGSLLPIGALGVIAGGWTMDVLHVAARHDAVSMVPVIDPVGRRVGMHVRF